MTERIDLFRLHNEGRLPAVLEGLEIEEIRKVVRITGYDGTGKARKWKDKARLIEFLCARVKARSEKGDVFRHHSREKGNDVLQ